MSYRSAPREERPNVALVYFVSHCGAKPGLTKRWSLGSAAIAARSASSSLTSSAARLLLLAGLALRFRDRHHAVLLQQPRQRHLRRRGAVLVGDGLQLRIVGEPALRQRRVGGERNGLVWRNRPSACPGRAARDTRPDCRRSARRCLPPPASAAPPENCTPRSPARRPAP